MILEFSEKEESKLLLKLVVENNILLKCILQDLSSMQAEIMEIGEHVLPQNISQQKLELLKKNRRNLSDRIDEVHDNYLESMTPIIEKALREYVKAMRNGNLDKVLEDIQNDN